MCAKYQHDYELLSLRDDYLSRPLEEKDLNSGLQAFKVKLRFLINDQAYHTKKMQPDIKKFP